jgi:hypothetical protein
LAPSFKSSTFMLSHAVCLRVETRVRLDFDQKSLF